MTGLYGRVHEHDKEFDCEMARKTNNQRHSMSCKNWKPEWRYVSAAKDMTGRMVQK